MPCAARCGAEFSCYATPSIAIHDAAPTTKPPPHAKAVVGKQSNQAVLNL